MLFSRTPEINETVQATANAFGYLPELNGKILLLNMPYTLLRVHGEIKSVLTRNLPPY